MGRVLLVDVCRDELHSLEFVRPVERIVADAGWEYDVIRLANFREEYLDGFSHVIICGTALSDDSYLDDVDAFTCLRHFDGRVLGICAGMQILGLLYSGRLLDCSEIGYHFEDFTEEFLGVVGSIEVYHLHRHYVDFFDLDEFRVVCQSSHDVAQAVVHTSLPWYGVLFHPEVRHSGIIESFLRKS